VIPKAFITEWRARAPWSHDAWVEQDLACFDRYMTAGGHRVSRAQFEANLHAKRSDPSFRGDIEPLLRPGTTWDIDLAMDTVLERVVSGLGGDAWKGSAESRGGSDSPSI
jgi:hypothetical protein